MSTQHTKHAIDEVWADSGFYYIKMNDYVMELYIPDGDEEDILEDIMYGTFDEIIQYELDRTIEDK